MGCCQTKPAVIDETSAERGTNDTSGVFMRLIGTVIKRVERWLSSDLDRFRWYGDRFYKAVLEQELAATDLVAGSRVLHVGVGALPYTAFYLAQHGIEVDAVDNDARMPERARRLLEKTGVAHRVNVMEADGRDVDPVPYDAVWVSLNVSPKETVIERLVAAARPGTWIVSREPRGWLRLFYRRTRCSLMCGGPEDTVARLPIGKAAFVFRVAGSYTGEGATASSPKHTPSLNRTGLPRGAETLLASPSLNCLLPGQKGIVSDVPAVDLLPALGIRKGKRLTIIARSVAGGPVLVCVDDRTIAIDRSIAKRVALAAND